MSLTTTSTSIPFDRDQDYELEREEYELVSMGVLETKHGLPKTEKDRASGGWARTKKV